MSVIRWFSWRYMYIDIIFSGFFFVLCETFWILLVSSSCLGLFVLKYTPFQRLSRRCIDVGYKIYWNIYKVTTYMYISEKREIKCDTWTHWSHSLLWIPHASVPVCVYVLEIYIYTLYTMLNLKKDYLIIIRLFDYVYQSRNHFL